MRDTKAIIAEASMQARIEHAKAQIEYWKIMTKESIPAHHSEKRRVEQTKKKWDALSRCWRDLVI